MNNMKVILVTGASGYLGGRLCHALLDQGFTVKAFVRKTSDVSSLPPSTDDAGDLTLVYGDVTDFPSLLEAFAGCHLIFHAAALVEPWIPDPDRFISVHPAKHFCTHYEKSKTVADKIVLDAAAEGVPIVPVYPGVMYGPGKVTTGNLVAHLLVERFSGRLRGYVGEEQGFSFCHVDDVVQGHIAVISKGRQGERYLLTGENASFKDVFDIAAEITQTSKPQFHIPLFLVDAYGWVCILFSRITGNPPLISPPVVDVLRHQWAYTCEKAKKELDYNPRSLKDGLTELLPWLKSEGLIKY